MFQSFEVKSTPVHGKPRIAALRGLFDELGIDIEPLVPEPVFRWHRKK